MRLPWLITTLSVFVGFAGISSEGSAVKPALYFTGSIETNLLFPTVSTYLDSESDPMVLVAMKRIAVVLAWTSLLGAEAQEPDHVNK